MSNAYLIHQEPNDLEGVNTPTHSTKQIAPSGSAGEPVTGSSPEERPTASDYDQQMTAPNSKAPSRKQSTQGQLVSSELVSYASQKRIFALLEELIDSLLDHRPAEPIGFLVEALMEKMKQSEQSCGGDNSQ